jgi:putative flavoprotein involved in K+ transport
VHDADLYARLEKAGFLLDYGDDESGLHMKYIRRGSGYYIDVGASELVADGRIKLKTDVAVDHLTENSVVFRDGSELPADLVVSATGYGSMNGWAAKLINQEVADRVGKCWGIGSHTTKDPGPWEGELRNMWKPTQQRGWRGCRRRSMRWRRRITGRRQVVSVHRLGDAARR